MPTCLRGAVFFETQCRTSQHEITVNQDEVKKGNSAISNREPAYIISVTIVMESGFCNNQ